MYHSFLSQQVTDLATQAIVNHEESIAQLSKALAQITTVLPKADIKLLLYPTERIKLEVSILYGHLMEFIQRAISWYEAGRVKHVLIAMFRPTKLEFQDISHKICCSSQAIDQLAATANQAELRDLHLLFMEFKRTMIGAQIRPFFLDILKLIN
jgi:hypothetical protein